MPVNRQQHFVSQFTIREFLGGRDRLFCLDKSTLQVVDRVHGNVPADILKRHSYYTTDADDFDGEIVKPLENSLGPIIRKFVAQPDGTTTLPERRLLVDWFALALTRNLYFAHVAPIAYDSLSPEDKASLPEDGKAMTLVARRATYNQLRKNLHSIPLRLQFLKSPDDFGYYLTDNPTAPIPFQRIDAIGPVLLPLSHRLMAVLVPEDLTTEFYRAFHPTLEWLALLLCGWSQRLIYSADLGALDFASWVLAEGSGDYPKEMRERASLPFFGFGDPADLAAIWSAPVAPML